MSKPTYLGANVDVTTDSFAAWIDKTNQVRYDMGTVVVTVGSVLQPNATNGATTSGNAHVEGYLSANTLIASTELRGGSVSGSGLLSITSNTTFSNSAVIEIANTNVNFNVRGTNTNIYSNTLIAGTTSSITANTTVSGATLAISAVSTFTGNTNIQGALSLITANVHITNANTYIDASETYIGSNSTDLLIVQSVSTFSSDVTINSNTAITANLVHSGALAQFDNNVIAGSNSSDTFTVNASINSDMVPSANNTLDLGSVSYRWGNGHFKSVLTSDVFSANITSSDTMTAANLTISGTFETGNSSIVNLGGAVNIGNDISDTLTVTALIDSAIIPAANTTYDLGSISNYWRNLFVANLVSADTVELKGGRLEMARPDGNNRIVVESANTSYQQMYVEFNHTSGTANVTPYVLTRTAISPTTHRGASLGTTGERFDKVYAVDVTANTAVLGGAIGQQVLLTGGDVRIQGNLRVDGNTSLSSNNVLSLAEGEIDNLTVFDTITLDPLATWTGNVTPAVNNSVVIGTPSKVLSAVHATNLNGNLAWSSITSKPDPTVSVTLTGDVTGSGSATMTDLANGNISFATTIQPNSVALGADTTGNYVATVAAGAGMVVTGSGTENAAVTVAHSDTSSVANAAVDNASGTVIQDFAMTFDAYGHVVSHTINSVNLDGRYYTETEADARFVNVSGDTMTGELSGPLFSTNYLDSSSGNSMFITAGETRSQFETNLSNTGEFIYIGSENGVKVYSSVDNWAGAWSSSHRVATLLDSSGNSSFPGTVSATTFSGAFSGSGAAITSLNGSNISTGTVADARIASTIVRTSRTISTGDGLTGGGDLAANRTFAVDTSVVRTSGNQTLADTKTFTGLLLSQRSSDEHIRMNHTSASGNPYISWYQDGTRRAYIQYSDSGDYLRLVNDTTDEELRIDSGTNGLIFVEGGNARTVYHNGNIPNASITISAGNVLGGGGVFTTNQSGNETITINHDTITQTVSYVPGGVGSNDVVTSLTYDGYGHVTSYTTRDPNILSGNFYVNSGDIIGAGDIAINGDANIAGQTTFGYDTYNLSSTSGQGANIGGGGQLTIQRESTAGDAINAIQLYHGDDTDIVFNVKNNGNVNNLNGTYGTISDRRVKTDIVDAESQWEDVKSIRMRNYKLIKDVEKNGDDAKVLLGVIAQELIESGMNGIVDYDDDEKLYTVKTSVMLLKSVKALQEAMDRIEILETKLNAIESN